MGEVKGRREGNVGWGMKRGEGKVVMREERDGEARAGWRHGLRQEKVWGWWKETKERGGGSKG